MITIERKNNNYSNVIKRCHKRGEAASKYTSDKGEMCSSKGRRPIPLHRKGVSQLSVNSDYISCSPITIENIFLSKKFEKRSNVPIGRKKYLGLKSEEKDNTLV